MGKTEIITVIVASNNDCIIDEVMVFTSTYNAEKRFSDIVYEICTDNTIPHKDIMEIISNSIDDGVYNDDSVSVFITHATNQLNVCACSTK